MTGCVRRITPSAFGEGLEAALVVQHPVAYLVKSDGGTCSRGSGRAWRSRSASAWRVTLGLGLQSRQFTFKTQELIGGYARIVAVCFVTWMIFWMARAARTIVLAAW